MCGICGYNGKQPSVDLILNILEKLEPHVGGKGTGIAFRLDSKILLLKYKGNLKEFREKFNQSNELIEIKNNGYLGIAHTRRPSSSFFLNEDRFSHPLFDCNRTLALVHNGSLDSDKLHRDHRQMFDAHTFATKKKEKILDSELLIHMIEHFHAKGDSLLDAIKKTFSIAKAYGKLKGFGMFAVISSEEENIYIAYGLHEENSIEIKRNNDGFYFYTINNKLKDIIETEEEVSDWEPYNRNQIIIIGKDNIKFEEISMANEHYNPYDFINPIKDPKLFAGRKKELKEIDYYLELSRSKLPKYTHLALIGDRASGKTSLLNMIEFMANEKGLLAVKIPLNKETSSSDVLFFKEVIDGIMTKGAERGMYGGIKGKTYRAFRRLIDNLDVKVEIPLYFGTAYIGLKKKEHEARIPQHVLIHDLEELSKEAKKQGIVTIVLLFDECDLLAQNETLLQKIRNAFMEVEGYILAFSGTERMFPALSDVFSPIPRFFKRINVENFDFKETEECILKPLTEEESKILDRRSIGDIHWLTGGLPYEVNLISHYMYRRHQETKSPTIGLSIEVLDDVLNELERLRKGEHHEIANKIRVCGPQQLKALISLTEFPKSRQEWLVKYALLDDLQFLTPKKAVEESGITNLVIEELKMSGIIEENSDKQLFFKGDQFDFLYLKYYAISKGIKDFFVGFKDDTIMNLHMKLERIMLKDFEEYETHTRFDKKEFFKGMGMGRKALIGAKVKFAKPGWHTVLEFTPEELERKFYLGTPNSTRFRMNVNYIKEGFVTQITFKKLEEAKKLSDSLDLLKDKLKLADIDLLLKDEIAWNIEGTEFSKQKKFTEAIKCFDEAIRINSMFELLWVNKGLALFNLKDYEKALGCFEKAIEIHPKFGGAWENKGKTLINLGRNEEALECLNKAIEYEPENWSAWDNKGRALFNLKRLEEAIECFDKVLKVNPEYVEVLKLKASALGRLGKFDEAITCYDDLLKIDPENMDFLMSKGLALCETKKFEEAIGVFDKALEINHRNTDAWILKGLALSEIGKYKEAIECCDKVLEIEPNHGVAWYNKACFESRSGNVDDAILCLEKAIQFDELFIESARAEKDFDNIKTDDRFLKLVTKK